MMNRFRACLQVRFQSKTGVMKVSWTELKNSLYKPEDLVLSHQG
jgi:hypothetical protein